MWMSIGIYMPMNSNNRVYILVSLITYHIHSMIMSVSTCKASLYIWWSIYSALDNVLYALYVIILNFHPSHTLRDLLYHVFHVH